MHCGHIVSCANNGVTDITNLRPICSTCNLAMGSEHMKTFMINMGYDINNKEFPEKIRNKKRKWKKK